MSGPYESYGITPTSPATEPYAITPSNSTVLDPIPKSLYVGTAGDVAITTLGGNAVTFPNVPAGAVLYTRCQKVLATGTTASDIVAYAD